MKNGANEWATALQEIRQDSLDTVEPGFVTLHQFATDVGVSESYARKLIRDLLRAGKAEKKMFRVETGRGPFRIPFYKRIRGKKK